MTATAEATPGTLPMTDLAVHAPGTDWRPLRTRAAAAVTTPETEDQKRELDRNREELKAALLSSMQMQHLVVLAGSGCSLSAGGPSMGDLWNAAVGQPPAQKAQEVGGKVGHDVTQDLNLEALLSKVEAFLQVQQDATAADFLMASKAVILDRCSRFHQADTLKAHQTFLHRLSRRRVRDQRLKLFTTNYDLCFERAAGELGIVALDGFSFMAPRRYDPSYFAYDIIRRPRGADDVGRYLEGVFLLYKLHGSVNWARTNNGQIEEKSAPVPEEACLIYPARGKYQQTFTNPYLESLAQYLVAIREPNTCVIVIGFGFSDDHLSEPLLSAVRSNPHLRVIIVDPSARHSTTAATTSNSYWSQFSSLAKSGEDIWLISAKFDDFAVMIPDLKALTPAEKLLKAVNDATERR